MSTATNSWTSPPATANTKDSNGNDLAAHLSNLAVDDYNSNIRQAQQHKPTPYANVHTPPRPAPFTPYEGPAAQYLYYATGGAVDPAAFAAAAAAAAAVSPHQYPYDLPTQMQSLASAAPTGMYDAYPTPPDTYSPDRSSSISSNGTPSIFQPQTPAFQPQTPAFQPQSPLSNASRVNAQVYRPPHLQQQLQQQQSQQPNYYAYDNCAPYWAAAQPQSVGRENGGAGERNRHMHPNFGSGGRRGSQHHQYPSQADFRSYGLQTPLTPAFTGPGGQFPLPTGYGPPYSPSPGGHFSFKTRRPMLDETGIVRSQRLEDFRQRKVTRLELEDIYGSICEFAGDQHGSRFIQNKLETATPEERAKVFEEIMPNAYQLMTDVFGNYVIQKMFQYGDQQQMGALAKKMEGHVLQLSMQMYGCRVMQKALEHLALHQREKLVAELDGHIIDCVKSSNANHVIQRLISLDPPQKITDAFRGHVQELSSHPFGCRVLQKSFEVLDPVKIRPLLDEMHKCSLTLMFDQFGNYVVQSVISSEPGREQDRDKVIAQMKTRIFELSRHKFASNVVERAIRFARPHDKREIIREMLKDDSENRIATLLRDSFGNFTVQTALNEAEPDQRDQLLSVILPLMPNLRHTPCGRRLEAKITEYEREGVLPHSAMSSATLTVSVTASPSTSSDSTVASLVSDSIDVKGSALRRVSTSPDEADEALVYKALMV